VAPASFNSRTSSLAELLANPESKAIIFSEAPPLERTLTSKQIHPYLGNLSLHSLVGFGVIAPGTVERIDARLKALSKGGAR
jgi:hypothetical protein